MTSLLALGLGCNSASDSDCAYAPIENEAGCPETFDAAVLGTFCSQIGLTCRYPESEYGSSSCNGPLLLGCGADQPDAGLGMWYTPLP